MTIPRHILGTYGEQLACDYLISKNYEVLDRNWRCSLGEIDVVAKYQDTLVFVEVKTRNGRGFGHPFEAITEPKRKRLRKLSHAWLEANAAPAGSIRIDAVSILVAGGLVEIEHLKQVF